MKNVIIESLIYFWVCYYDTWHFIQLRFSKRKFKGWLIDGSRTKLKRYLIAIPDQSRNSWIFLGSLLHVVGWGIKDLEIKFNNLICRYRNRESPMERINTLAVVYYDGTVSWVPLEKLYVSCDLDDIRWMDNTTETNCSLK